MKREINILLSRTDAIGDVVLSLPMASILKNLYPECKIYFLGQTYTKEIIGCCENIDKFIDWKELKLLSLNAQIDYLRNLDITVGIHVFPNFHISWLFKKAGIPTRIGTSRRWYHWLYCNQKVSFSRHRSNLHESQLNLNLLIPLGFNEPFSFDHIKKLYGLKAPEISEELSSLLDKNKFNLILHPKSRGNGKEWGLENFSNLIGLLDKERYKVFITGTKGEYNVIFHEILSKHPNVVNLVDRISLTEFVGFIAKADGLIASGTGPLHIAAALGVHAIGLYPPIRPVFAKRWAPVGANAKAFEAQKTCVKCNKHAKCDCLKHLSPCVIQSYLKNLNKIDHAAIVSKISGYTETDYNKLEHLALAPEAFINMPKACYPSNESLYKSLQVLVSLDKINKPNCGLGRVTIDFSKALANNHDKDVEITYVVTGNNDQEHLYEQPTRKFKFMNRVVPANYGHYHVLHKLHQTPSFKIKGAEKTVLTIHDLNFLYTKSKFKAKEYLKQVQKNVNDADAIVFISKFTKEVCLQNLNIPKDKIVRIVYNGVELPDVKPQRPYHVNGESYLFSIGQFLSKKNFHVLLPFLAQLPKHIKLIISGENNTSYGNQIRKQILDLNLQSRVLLTGPVTEAEKLFLYQHCMAFVFPSLAEGFGLPVIEAMRCRKPVFCSDKTSLKEIGDKYVYFWENFDPVYMKSIFDSGLEDFNSEKCELAYNYSLQFTWQKNAEAYFDLYKSLFRKQ